MCNDKIERRAIKRGSGEPTIPVSTDHRNGDWIATDIYEGEMYQDDDTGIVYIRNGTSIRPIEKINTVTNSVIDITETSVTDDFIDFTTGTLSAPATIDGDEIKITAVFRYNTAPASNGYGLYFFFDNSDYVHPSSSSPTYANSFFQLPFDRDNLWIEITVHRIDSSNAYVICKQVLGYDGGLTATTYGEEAYASITLNWSTFTDIKVQTFITAGGEITLEYLKIKKLTA